MDHRGDLPTRLREAFQRKRYGGDGDYDPDFDLFEAAADEIGRYDREIAMLRADCARMDAEIERLRVGLVRTDDRIEACRQFIARHPALTDVDRAEFEAFLKVPDAMRFGMTN